VARRQGGDDGIEQGGGVTNTMTLNGVTASEDPAAPIMLTAYPGGAGVEARTNRVNRPTGGKTPNGKDVAESRNLTWEAAVVRPITGAESDVVDTVDQVVGAWSPSSTTVELAYTIGGRNKIRRGRPVSCDVEYGMLPEWAPVRMVFECLDPVVYAGGDPKQAFVTMPVSGDGVTVASGGVTVASGGVTVAGGAVSGDAPAANNGYAPVDWIAQVIGPVVNPRVNVAGGIVLLNVTLAAGDVGYLDSRRHTFILGGTVVNVIDPTSSVWRQLPPRTSSIFALRGESGTGTAVLVWRDGSYS
jgi:hypothetical protein